MVTTMNEKAEVIIKLKLNPKAFKPYHREYKHTVRAALAKNHSMASQMEARIATRMAAELYRKAKTAKTIEQ
jgi:hypothetical protein